MHYFLFTLQEQSSCSGSDIDEPQSKCRRLSSSSADSVYSSASSHQPRSSTAASVSGSDFGSSSRETSPTANKSNLLSSKQTKPIEAKTVEVNESQHAVNAILVTPQVDIPQTKKHTSSDELDSCRQIRRRAESVASKRKPRRKKRRLAADAEVTTSNDGNQLKPEKPWTEHDLNISETGSYIEVRHHYYLIM